MEKLTREQFINKAKSIHGDRYDYSLVDYINCKTKINIVCEKHGVFEQLPHTHLKGANCRKCNKCNTTDEFIKYAKLIHGNRYDYSLSNYIENREKITILCKIHGSFEQNPSNHIRGDVLNVTEV